MNPTAVIAPIAVPIAIGAVILAATSDEAVKKVAFKGDKPSSSLESFLSEFDKSLVKAYLNRSTNYLKDFVNLDGYHSIVSDIAANRNKNFGVDKYRNVTYELKFGKLECYVIKTTTHDKVKDLSGIKVGLGNNIRESFTVVRDSSNRYKVSKFVTEYCY